MKKALTVVLATMLAVCALALAACGGDSGKQVSYAEFLAKAQQAQATDPCYTGGQISFKRNTAYFGLMEYEGGFTYADGTATLSNPQSGNKNGRDESKWVLENERAWNVENHPDAVYKLTDNGFVYTYAGTNTYYDSYGYFVKETHKVITTEGWLVEVTWTK